MPVHLETHTPDLDIDPSTTKGRILAFLYQHPEYGYKPAEIQDELAIPHGTATTTLSRLLAEDYIGKTPDSYYHSLEDRPTLKRYAASYTQLSRLTDHFSDSPSIEATQTMARDAQLAVAREESPTDDTVAMELAALDNAVDPDDDT